MYNSVVIWNGSEANLSDFTLNSLSLEDASFIHPDLNSSDFGKALYIAIMNSKIGHWFLEDQRRLLDDGIANESHFEFLKIFKKISFDSMILIVIFLLGLLIIILLCINCFKCFRYIFNSKAKKGPRTGITLTE